MSVDPFVLFGLPPGFALDAGALEQAYHRRSREVHPDRYATAPAAERVAALARARALNDAYVTLKKPVTRAEYLLAQAGVHIGDHERLDEVFLLQILEQREELAEARAAGRLAEVERLAGAMRTRRRELLDGLAPGFERAGAADPALRAAALSELTRTLIMLRYLDRYLEECDAALDDDPAAG